MENEYLPEIRSVARQLLETQTQLMAMVDALMQTQAKILEQQNRIEIELEKEQRAKKIKNLLGEIVVQGKYEEAKAIIQSFI